MARGRRPIASEQTIGRRTTLISPLHKELTSITPPFIQCAHAFRFHDDAAGRPIEWPQPETNNLMEEEMMWRGPALIHTYTSRGRPSNRSRFLLAMRTTCGRYGATSRSVFLRQAADESWQSRQPHHTRRKLAAVWSTTFVLKERLRESGDQMRDAKLWMAGAWSVSRITPISYTLPIRNMLETGA